MLIGREAVGRRRDERLLFQSYGKLQDTLAIIVSVRRDRVSVVTMNGIDPLL